MAPSSASAPQSAQPWRSATSSSSSNRHEEAMGEKQDGPAPDDAVARWRSTTRAKAVDGSPERRETFVTTSELPVDDVYTEASLPGWDPASNVGLPGEFPFTRGVQATMY